MGVFNGLVQIDKNGNVFYDQWVEWDHFWVPNKPEWLREIFRNILAILGHCMNCSALDGCYFIDNNKPDQPLHQHCDCQKKIISYLEVKTKATASCDIRKFTEYVFKNDYKSKGKNKIFYDLGYNLNDAEFLQNEFCKQALNQYLKGNYKLKNLDRNGQRLAIVITLNGKIFYSGWLLCPEGKIKNITPFGGWVK